MTSMTDAERDARLLYTTDLTTELFSLRALLHEARRYVADAAGDFYSEPPTNAQALLDKINFALDARSEMDDIGIAIMELVDLNNINDHISMRVILGKLVAAERERIAKSVEAYSSEGPPAQWYVAPLCGEIAARIRSGK